MPFAIHLLIPLMRGQVLDISAGARTGVQLNRRNIDRVAVTSQQSVAASSDQTQRIGIGPTFELGWKERFAIEFSPTYRREGSTFYSNIILLEIPPLPTGGVALLSQFSRTSGHVWDLPLVGKYYFAGKEARIRPFVGGGASASRHSQTSEYLSQIQTDGGERRPQSFRNHETSWGFGPVVSAGVSIRSGRLSIVPEFRYLRDSRPSYPGTSNRAEFFLGFRFH
ncbi:MAG: outer membrane beta-barrel protein [Bryobacterales bacterium]|nr:outer membrane beta-barrel protein [Bryobacterales bacterium]